MPGSAGVARRFGFGLRGQQRGDGRSLAVYFEQIIVAQTTQQHIIWLLIFRVQLKACPLEILDQILFAVAGRRFFDLFADRQAIDSKSTVSLPIGQEAPAEIMSATAEPAIIGAVGLLRAGVEFAPGG